MPSLTSSPAWQALVAHRDALAGRRIGQLWEDDPERGPAFTFTCAGIAADFSKQRIDAQALALLVALARDRGVPAAIERLFAGERVNVTEDRPALHTALRGDEHVMVDGRDVLPEVQRNRQRMRVVAQAVREGHWKGHTGEPIRHVLALGIGGSALGPKLVLEGLRAEHDGPEVRFVVNVDAAEFDDAVAGIDPASTLVVIASKTFTTQETMANAAAARRWIVGSLGEPALARHVVAATANNEAAAAWGLPECNVFPFSEWVGGRFSVWSSVGLPVAIGVGMPRFEQFLAGAHAADLAFRSTPLERNVPVLAALVGLWNRNMLGAPTLAVLSYASRLESLPAYLQQLEMESNGKRVDTDGNPLDAPSCPVVWGGTGTPGQHAFHQWLHQGTDPVACDFIVVARAMGAHREHHEILLAHACAQSEALMDGLATPQTHKACPGDRPSTTYVLPALDPYSLGALLAIYEHKVFAQGVVWGIDSFDQWGVELGKTIAGKILPAIRGGEATLHPATHHLLGLIHKLGREYVLADAMASDDFKRIFETLRVAVVVTDARGGVQYANSTFGQLAGHDGRVLAGSSLTELFAADDRKRVAQNLARVGEGKAASAFLDAMLLPPEGTPRWVSVALQPALDAKDKAAGVVAILQDIGTQRETDEALNLVSARLLALAEASPVAMMIETAPGEVELANEAFCRMLGIESAAQSLSGLPVADVMARAPEAARGLERREIMVEGEPAGAVWTARGAGTPAKGAAEIALIEKIAEELTIALEGMSAISIRAQQMEFEPHLIEHFQNMRQSTETALAAIGDLVDFSKLSGRVVLHKSTFSLRAALADLVARVAPNAEEHGCRLRLKVEQDVSDTLEGDVERLQLILKNLLDNAFNLMPGATVMLQITPEYMTEAGIQLSFSVAAEGPSVAALGSRALDAGMGVAVAKFMVAAMSGQLAVAARAGGEPIYAFTIEFPVAPAPPAPRRATHASLVAMPVLVVFEDPDQRLHLANVLRGWRMVPLEADNAPMAMALLERMDQEGTPIPLVILSNKLPVQDGFLLAFRIKHDPKHGSTLVMMLASEGKPGDAIACRENSIAAYMRYPIADRQLNEAIVAVTGASVDSDETPTLVTRHSLREKRKGATILLVDRSRDSQILAAHILGRMDCSVVVAHDLAEAGAALDQDVYDMVLVDTSLAGLEGPDAAVTLRARITRDPEATTLVAVSLDHSPAYRKARLAEGFNATLAKPFRKDDLLALLSKATRTTTA